jgi:hypothetical protein
MSSGDGVPSGSARGVVREIDRELDRLEKIERTVANERKLLLSARSALTRDGGAGPELRRRVSHNEIAAFLAENPGSSTAHVAEALQASTTSVSTHLQRGKHTRYESRNRRWYLRPLPGWNTNSRASDHQDLTRRP